MATLTLSERLNEAEDALHLLMTGRAVTVFVDQNQERVEYNLANLPRLQAYIADLKRQIGDSTPRPMSVFI